MSEMIIYSEHKGVTTIKFITGFSALRVNFMILECYGRALPAVGNGRLRAILCPSLLRRRYIAHYDT